MTTEAKKTKSFEGLLAQIRQLNERLDAQQKATKPTLLSALMGRNQTKSTTVQPTAPGLLSHLIRQGR